MMSLNKTVEMMGGLGDVNRAGAIAEGVFKAVQSSGRMVDERQLKQFVAYASSAGNQQSLRTIFGGLEPIIGELGGSTTAVGLRTAYTRTNGMMSLPPKLMLSEMQRLGMTDATGRKQNADLAQLQSTDAIAYAAEMMKRYDGAGIKTTTDRERENAIIFGTNGSKVYNKIMAQMPVLQHSLHAYDQARGPAATIKDNETSPQMAIEKFNKALSDLGLILGQTVLPVLTPFVQQLTGLIKSLNEHPSLVKNLTLGFVGLASAMAFSGTLLTIATGFKAIGGVVSLIAGAGGVLALGAASPVVLGLAAIAAALGVIYLVSKVKVGPQNNQGSLEDFHAGRGNQSSRYYGLNSKAGAGRGSGVGDHWKLLQSALPFSENAPWNSGGSPTRQAINNTIVMPNGQVLAKVVTDVQSKELGRPATGGRSFDGSMSPRLLGAH